MRLQEDFSKMVAHLRAQGARAIISDFEGAVTCRYRTPERVSEERSRIQLSSAQASRAQRGVMKPYGNSRRDNAICQWGCCHGRFVRGSHYSHYSPSPKIRRRSKRRARQEGVREIQENQS